METSLICLLLVEVGVTARNDHIMEWMIFPFNKVLITVRALYFFGKNFELAFSFLGHF